MASSSIRANPRPAIPVSHAVLDPIFPLDLSLPVNMPIKKPG
jgi:hypothetical protein